MKTIDLSTWHRRRHFELFHSMDYPHFGLCADVDIAPLYHWARGCNYSVNTTIAFVLAKAANHVPEFRLRIHASDVVEYEEIHPSFTVLTEGDLFSYCTVPYNEDFPAFSADATRRIAAVKANPVLEDEPGDDNLIFMSSIPWIHFTSVSHPIHFHPADSVPRLTWGKFAAKKERIFMPLAVQVHHGLMDGIHVGRFYSLVEEYCQHPENLVESNGCL